MPHGSEGCVLSVQVRVRRIAYRSDKSYSYYRSYVEEGPPETAANTILCLIHQANHLLDHQIASLEQRFLKEGGFTERLYHARQRHRAASNPSHPSYRSYLNDPGTREAR
jgi:four helix bundle suffix protein